MAPASSRGNGELLGLPAVFILSGIACGMLVLGTRIVTDGAIVAAEREAEAAAETAVAERAAAADVPIAEG